MTTELVMNTEAVELNAKEMELADNLRHVRLDFVWGQITHRLHYYDSPVHAGLRMLPLPSVEEEDA